MDTLLLKYHWQKHGDTRESLAAALGLHVVSLSRKLRHYSSGKGADFTLGEAKTIVQRYNLTPQEAWDIFFTDEPSTKPVQPHE